MSDHDHHHHSSFRALVFVLILSLFYMFAEIVGGWMSGSLAVLADAGHMATDVAAISLSLFAMWVARKPATAEKTYGYYRAEILAALVNGALLVAVSVWIFYEAYSRFNEPRVIQGMWMTLIAAGGLVVNLIALYLTHHGSEHSLNMRAVRLHVISDTLGSLSAIVAGLLVWLVGWKLADPVISVLIAVLILVNSWKLLTECVNVLLEGAPKNIQVDSVRQALESHPDVVGIHDLHVWTLTSRVTALSAHISVKQNTDTHLVLDSLTVLLRDKFEIHHATLQIELSGFEHPSWEGCHQ